MGADNPKDQNQPEQDREVSHGQTQSPLKIVMAPDARIWEEARRMAGNKSTSLNDFAICASQDPILALELLKRSNSMFVSAGRSAITNVKTAIGRLGYDLVTEMLHSLLERERIEDEEIGHWLEFYRSKSRRLSILAKIIAEALSRNLSDDCQAIGVLSCMGDMLAVAYFKEEYVKLADELARSGINYQLVHKFNFDVEEMGVRYLKKHGIPEALLFAIDRSAVPRTPDRAIMRPIVFAAMEMVDAFDANRWEKLAPGRMLPPKSSIRLLQMSDSQYLKIYERSAEYLFNARIDEERKRHEEIQKTVDDSRPEVLQINSEDEQSLASDIAMLMEDFDESEESLEAEDAPLIIEGQVEEIPPELGRPSGRELKDRFRLGVSAPKRAPRRSDAAPPPPPPRLRTQHGTAIVSSVAGMFDKVQTSEELLTRLLEMLVQDGLFEKSALIVVSQDRNYAIVVAARGPNIGNGQRLALGDPLSPLARCFSKVQSYGNRGNKSSPFGSKAFALAPIDADHETPVALYADCGNNGSLTFEARRIFRTVVALLNEKLPTIRGGIPNELRE